MKCLTEAYTDYVPQLPSEWNRYLSRLGFNVKKEISCVPAHREVYDLPFGSLF